MPLFVSHAQNWEDVRLRRIFSETPSGFYIDVGAAHPVFHSFTHMLHQQGWRGVNIEPLPTFFSLLEDERPDDVNLQVVLGRSEHATKPFFEVVELPGSSTYSPGIAHDLRAQGHTVVEHAVPLTTLRSVCERYAPERIDLLKVDVEGAEADVLAGGDWERFRPRLVVVEANTPERWEPLLRECGYTKAAFDGVSNWYVEASDSAWIDVLAPPVSVLDEFVPYELVLHCGRARTADPAPSPRTTSGASLPRLLIVLSSTNQLYSGTGRVLFENLRRLIDRFAIEIAIDDHEVRNSRIAKDFCTRHGLRCHLGQATAVTGPSDSGNRSLGGLLGSGSWDIVMGVSWANAATNTALLQSLGDAALAYLPLHQPSCSIPLDAAGRTVVERVHREMLVRADVILCLTPSERGDLAALVTPTSVRCAVVPPGCDFSQFRPGLGRRADDLLFVGDFREPRKRFDRVVAALDHVRRRGVGARLLVIGNQSEQAALTVPKELASAVVSLGYVDEECLRRAYREAAVLLLLSEYEAFGLPIIESLASATPVVMADQLALASLVTQDDGVHFVDPDNPDAVADAVVTLLLAGAAPHEQLARRHAHLAQTFNWDVSALRIRDHLLAAWARRMRETAGFLPLLQASTR